MVFLVRRPDHIRALVFFSKPCSVPNLDLPALCSPRFKPGPPGDEAQVLSERLNEALIRCVMCECALLQTDSL
jgi:exosome complex RNA-binding protein Rrp42 (RNase PH superfamily)